MNTFKAVLVSAFFLSLGMARAQTVIMRRQLPFTPRDEMRLIHVAREELSHIAQASGYALNEDSAKLSLPKSNFLMPNATTSLAAIFGLNALVIFGGPVSIGVVLAVLGGGIVYEGSNTYYIPFADHYRAKLPYSAALEGEHFAGSCMLFFTAGFGPGRENYEIDECTHEHIFPQTRPGRLRMGGREDSIDRYFDQTEVVATGRF